MHHRFISFVSLMTATIGLLVICLFTEQSDAQEPGCDDTPNCSVFEIQQDNEINEQGGISNGDGTKTLFVDSHLVASCYQGMTPACSVCGSTIVYGGNTNSGPWVFLDSAVAQSPTYACGSGENEVIFNDTYGPVGGSGGTYGWYKMALGAMNGTPAGCPEAVTATPNGYLYNAGYFTYASYIFDDYVQ